MTTGYKVTEFFKKHHPKRPTNNVLIQNTIIKQEL